MKRTAIVLSFLAVFCITATHPAHAQAEDPILTLPDGQAILSISATERKEVEQDLLVATLQYDATNRDPRALQDEINTAMAKALKTTEKAGTSVKVSTGSYQVYDITDPRTRESKWRGQQTLTLQSKDADTVLDLAGELQDIGLNMSGLNYTLAPETAVAVQDALMEAALGQLQNRADRAAKALGKTKAELRDVNVQGNVPYPQPVMMRATMAMDTVAGAAMAPPVAAAGDTTITLTVSARAILKP